MLLCSIAEEMGRTSDRQEELAHADSGRRQEAEGAFSAIACHIGVYCLMAETPACRRILSEA